MRGRARRPRLQGIDGQHTTRRVRDHAFGAASKGSDPNEIAQLDEDLAQLIAGRGHWSSKLPAWRHTHATLMLGSPRMPNGLPKES